MFWNNKLIVLYCIIVNGTLKFTITKNELLTSFKLFDFAYLYVNGIYRINIRHDVLSNQQ